MSGVFIGLLVATVLIPALLGLAFLIWDLWALSRLFPKIGLKAGEGWVPILNIWRLLERGGFPGFISLGRVVFIVLLLLQLAVGFADASGRSPLSIVLMLLVGLSSLLVIVSIVFEAIAMHRINLEAGAGGGYTVLAVLINPLWAMLLAKLIGPRVLPGRGVPHPGYQGDFGQLVYGTPQQGATAPGYETHPGHAAPGQPTTPLYAPPLQAAQPARSTQPAAPLPPASPASPAQPWAPASGPGVGRAAAPQPAAPAAAAAPLGGETEAEYDRLAAESFQAPPAVPLGRDRVQTPFSWTAAAKAEPEPDAEPEPVIPPVHPLAMTPPTAATPPAPPEAPRPAVRTEAFAPPRPEPIAAPTPAVHKPTGITGKVDPLPKQASGAHEGRDAERTGDLDHTIVLPRRASSGWVLELPDGSRLPLDRDTVVGRRPEAPEGVSALVIPDSTRTLSKSHVRLTLEEDRWFVEDLGSTNGLVLLPEGGGEQEVPAGVRRPATQRMLFGTLEVRLRPGGDAA